MTRGRVAVLGIFAADVTFRAERLPRLGETLAASGFALGPGGKGSNQAIAAARAGAAVALISRIGDDAFGRLALDAWGEAGVEVGAVTIASDAPTGSAFIFIEAATGQNAIIVSSGAAGALSAAHAEAAREAIEGADVFVTQLEQPVEAALAALRIARRAGVVTILNPAPAMPLDAAFYPLCDYLTPNETEAEALTGVAVDDMDGARRAADALLACGVGMVALTLGPRGVLLHGPAGSTVVPAVDAGPVTETTGAGDAFNGGFATALAEGLGPLDAARFGCAAAGLSVTRAGAAAAMPTRAEIDALLRTTP